MSLAPATRTLLWTLAGVAVAAVIGTQIANESFLLPFTLAAAAIAIVVGRYSPRPLPAVLLALGLVGNIAGNRGFAQLYLSPSLPLLPAELILFSAGAIVLWDACLAKRLPLRMDLLNIAIVLWITLSLVRIPSDLHTFGPLALRDFVAVGYSTFFFIAQEVCRSPEDRKFLCRCLLYACLVLIPIYPIYYSFPDFFLDTLVLRGNPVIFYKGDLVGMFLAIGSALAFARFEASGKRLWLAACLMAAAEAFSLNNRASALALILAAVAFALMGRWKFIAGLGALALAAVVFYVGLATVTDRSWKDTPIYAGYEEVASLADPAGTGSYSGADTAMKGDNNAFRYTWWKITVDETIKNGPIMGLGWGYDLAAPFEQIYFPEGNEEFSTRSPHNILLSVFARGGFLSLAFFLLVLTAIGWRSFKCARMRQPETVYWLVCWMIFTTACLGVVLEGPMGALVFWTVLAIASAPLAERDAEKANRRVPGTEEPVLVALE